MLNLKKKFAKATISGNGSNNAASGTARQNSITVKTYEGPPLAPGSTISRAIPGDSISDLIQHHGPNSSQVARAYANNKDSNAGPNYIPAPNTYWNVDASIFNLRIGPNYKKNKQKASSAAALYDLHSFDIIEMPYTLDNVEERFKLPEIPGITDTETGHPDVPPMLVVISNLPHSEPSMMSTISDGKCLVSVFYFIISETTLEALKDLDNAAPAIKLFIQWAQRAEKDDEFRGRFKAMAVLDNIHKLGLPSFITNYNGKPVLINKSGNFKRHENYIEMSINVFLFNYIAKKSLHSLKPKFPTFVLNVGFTIEGRDDEELPEILLGGCCLHHLDPSNVLKDKGGDN